MAIFPMKSLNMFYDTLQVPRNATIAALRTAHKTLSERLQPDRNLDNSGAAALQLLQVNKALEVLTHPHARGAYDAWLGQRSGTLGAAGDIGVPTLPELVEPPSQANASSKVSSETLAPLPTLDLDGFAAEIAAKAKAKSSTTAPAPAVPAQTPASAPAPLSSAVATATATAPSTAKPTATLTPAPVPSLSINAPSTPSGFAETQPYHPSDADALPDLNASNRKAAAGAKATPSVGGQGTAVVRSAPLRAFDWLRDRPLALVAAALLSVLLIAFAPWLWHAAFGVIKAEVPATPALQPTYVEPPAEAVSAPASAVEPVEPVQVVPAVQDTSTPPPTESRPAHKAKPRKVVKRVAEPRRAQEPVAPVPQPEPVVAPVPVDPGGHTGYAPKCRWVTPTNWSCK
jgi:hypothetical protein